MTSAEYQPGAKLNRWASKIDNPVSALKQIGALMVAESQLAFKDQKFGGETWKPRGKVNVFGIIADFHAGKSAPPSRRFETRPALRDTGRLAASINFAIKGDTVEVGSLLDYAAVHQHGGETTSETVTEEVQKALAKWLKSKKGADHASRLGFLLNKRLTGTKLKQEVPQRRFLGVTDQTVEDIIEVIGSDIFETR